MKTGRNEPCHCGSGRKFKLCHGRESGNIASSQKLGWIVGVVVVAGAIAILASFRSADVDDAAPKKTAAATETALPSSPAPTPAPIPAGIPGSQPPGPAPAGKVWSKEHGHWHDAANPSQVQIQMQNVPASAHEEFPQPAGPVPAGKVWSKEHGHWHDAATGTRPDEQIPTDLAPMMQPPGVPAAPPGVVWSKEHHHWHRADAEAARKAAAASGSTTTATSTTSPATGTSH